MSAVRNASRSLARAMAASWTGSAGASTPSFSRKRSAISSLVRWTAGAMMWEGATPASWMMILTEVGFERLDARSDQRMVQADLLGRHAFHLHSAPHAVRPGDLQHDAVGFLPVSRPVDVAAGLSDTRFQQGQIVIKMGDGVETQVVPGLAKLLPPLVAENAHDTRARAQQTAGGPLDRGRYLRLDGLGVGAEVDGCGQLMHRSTPSCQDLDQAHRLDRGADPLQTAGNIHQAPGLADHHVFGAGGLDIA